MNIKNQLIAWKTLFVGGVNSSIVHPRDVFREALKLSAACFIAVHNHPSGDATPSREDIEVSERLVEAGNIVGIACFDHVIIGEERYVSMEQRGYMNGWSVESRQSDVCFLFAWSFNFFCKDEVL